jgi:hypothetical protein
VDTPKKRKGLLAFYISTGFLALLFVGFYFAWTSLELRYAIYKVQRTDYSPPTWADEWLMICLRAACDGNRDAMKAVIDHAGVTPSWTWEEAVEGRPQRFDVASWAAVCQPELFFDVLGGHDERRIFEVLDIVSERVKDAWFLEGAGVTFCPDRDMWLRCSFSKFMGRLKSGVESDDPYSRRVAGATIGFIRQRFAKELAEIDPLRKGSRAQKEVVQAMEEALKSEDPDVRQAAAGALKWTKAAQGKKQ